MSRKLFIPLCCHRNASIHRYGANANIYLKYTPKLNIISPCAFHRVDTIHRVTPDWAVRVS